MSNFADALNMQVDLSTPAPSEPERIMIAKCFGDPVIKRYLQHLSANQIQELANIPLTTIAQDGDYITSLKQAFFKGGLSMLQTLLSIESPQTPSGQSNQGQNTQR